MYLGYHSYAVRFFKDLVRYPLGREGVYTPGGCVWVAHVMGRVINIVGVEAVDKHRRLCNCRPTPYPV